MGAGKAVPVAATTGTGESGGAARLSMRSVAHDAAGRQSLFGANGRVVAWVQGGALCKTVDGSRHFLRQPPGIAFDAAILAQAADLGAARVRVTDRETGNTYRATLAAFTEHGVKIDRGFGVQVCLPFTFWQRETPGAPRQLALFA